MNSRACLNRDLSWLDFNARVLTLAEDESVPLLERVKFLAIFSQNLDEFFMVRVAGPHRAQRLHLVAERVDELVTRLAELFAGTLRPQLQAAGITIASWSDLDPVEQEQMRNYFDDCIFPMLTPLALGTDVGGLSLNFAAVLRDRSTGQRLMARVEVPGNITRFSPVSHDGKDLKVLPVEDLIASQLNRLFRDGKWPSITFSGLPETSNSPWTPSAKKTSSRRWSAN